MITVACRLQEAHSRIWTPKPETVCANAFVRPTQTIRYDMDSDRTLGLVSGNKGEELPTIAGLLTIGTTESIKRCVPTASATFQVMEGTTPRVNTDPFVLPLVDMFDRINDLMQPKSIVV